MHPLEIITHKSPRSFPHTVWIPHAEMHASVQIPARTQLCRMLAVKTVPAPFALHSLSPAQHWTFTIHKLLTMTKTLVSIR